MVPPNDERPTWTEYGWWLSTEEVRSPIAVKAIVTKLQTGITNELGGNDVLPEVEWYWYYQRLPI